jgi:CRP-like cAMP-binding protein
MEALKVLPPLKPGLEPKSRESVRPSRFGALNGFVDASMRDLTRAEIAAWLVLFRDTKKSGLVRTSHTDIARRSGVSPRSVVDAMRKLRARGLVTQVRRGNIHVGPSTYRVHPIGKE